MSTLHLLHADGFDLDKANEKLRAAAKLREARALAGIPREENTMTRCAAMIDAMRLTGSVLIATGDPEALYAAAAPLNEAGAMLALVDATHAELEQRRTRRQVGEPDKSPEEAFGNPPAEPDEGKTRIVSLRLTPPPAEPEAPAPQASSFQLALSLLQMSDGGPLVACAYAAQLRLMTDDSDTYNGAILALCATFPWLRAMVDENGLLDD